MNWKILLTSQTALVFVKPYIAIYFHTSGFFNSGALASDHVNAKTLSPVV